MLPYLCFLCMCLCEIYCSFWVFSSKNSQLKFNRSSSVTAAFQRESQWIFLIYRNFFFSWHMLAHNAHRFKNIYLKTFFNQSISDLPINRFQLIHDKHKIATCVTNIVAGLYLLYLSQCVFLCVFFPHPTHFPSPPLSSPPSLCVPMAQQ